MLCGSRKLSAVIKEHLAIDYGQTTPVSQLPAIYTCFMPGSLAIDHLSVRIELLSLNDLSWEMLLCLLPSGPRSLDVIMLSALSNDCLSICYG